jgi:hypothetical protein
MLSVRLCGGVGQELETGLMEDIASSYRSSSQDDWDWVSLVAIGLREGDGTRLIKQAPPPLSPPHDRSRCAILFAC